MKAPGLGQRLGAEFLGTFWLVLGGAGSAVFAAKVLSDDPTPVNMGIGFVGVALAFGLTVVTMAYAVGHVSGGHFNPAVTIGCAMGKRFAWKDMPAYVVTQVIAGLVGGGVIYAIASGKDGFDPVGHMAANGYAQNSPNGYSLVAAFITEVVLTAFFLYVILGSTDHRAHRLRAARHRSVADAHPPHLDPDHEHLREPGPLHGRRVLPRGGCPGPVVAVLGGTDSRRDHRRRHLLGDHRREPRGRRDAHRRARARRLTHHTQPLNRGWSREEARIGSGPGLFAHRGRPRRGERSYSENRSQVPSGRCLRRALVASKSL